MNEVLMILVKEVAKQVGGAVRESLGSWSRTGRLCCIVVAIGIAAGVYAHLKPGG